MNLHNNLKNLEGKYLDLANFYKSELVTPKEENPSGRAMTAKGNRANNSAVQNNFTSPRVGAKRTPRQELRDQIKSELEGQPGFV